MITVEMIDKVMERTGKDYFTIKNELEKTNGNIDEAIKNLGGTPDSDKANFTFNGKKVQLNTKDIIDTIKEIWEKGNASHLVIEKNGKEVLRINLVISGFALMVALQPIIIMLGVAVLADYKIRLIMADGNEININERALERKVNKENEDNN